MRELTDLSFGVGCESCHGPAENWLTEHYAFGWKDRQDKEALGFRHTKDLCVRAAVCAECHVGSPEKDVNHDLIAVGHPRLRFEFGAYLANLPKHWDAARDRERYPDFEARAWAIGQLTSTAAALRLLEARSRCGSKGRAPWPEFAEHDCFVCHHDLTPKSWRQTSAYTQQQPRPGSLAAASWYSALTPLLAAKLPAEIRPVGAITLVQELRLAMSRPAPQPDQVAPLAGVAAKYLESLLPAFDKQAFDRGTIASLIDALMDEGQAGPTWDEATQRFLGVQALQQALKELDSSSSAPFTEEWLRAMERRLEYPPKYDSPRGFNPLTFDAPNPKRGQEP